MILALEEFGELTLSELKDAVAAHLEGRFDGSIPWHVDWVKLDLEARGVIVCERRSGQPQMIRLATNE